MEDRIRFRQWSPPTRSGRTRLRKADDPTGKTPGAPPTPLKPKTMATSPRSGGSTLGSPEASPVAVPNPAPTSARSGGVTMTPTQAGVHEAQIGAQRSFAQRGGRSGAAGATVSGPPPVGVRQPSPGPTTGKPTPELPPGQAVPHPASPRSGGASGFVGSEVESAARGSRSGAAGETVRGPDLPVTRQPALRGPTVGTPKPSLPGAAGPQPGSSRSGGRFASTGEFQAAARPSRSGAVGEDVRGPTVVSAAGSGRVSPVAEHVTAQREAQEARNKQYGASPEGTGPRPFAAARAERGAAEAEKKLGEAKQAKIDAKKQAEATAIKPLPERGPGPNVQGWAQWGEGLGHATVQAQGGATSAGMWGQRGVAAAHGLLNRRTPPSVEAARQQREAQIQRQQALQAYRGELGGVHTQQKSLETPPVRAGIRRRTNNG